MNDSRLVTGMAAVFGGMALLMLVLALVFRDFVPLFVALAFGAATYFFWYQASGRMRKSLYERVEQRARTDGQGRRRRRTSARGPRGDGGRGGFGAGPREDWTPPGGEERWEYRYQQRGGRRGRAGAEVAARDGPTDREAYATLGLEPGADESDIKRAYRERAKETHPDTDDGDEDAFKEVTEAYEQLTE